MTQYVTVREAAVILKVSYRTVQRYLADGRIPYTKPVGRILIDIQDLTNFARMMAR